MIVFASSDGLLSKVLSDSIPTESAGTTNLANLGHDPDFGVPKLIGITSFGIESSSLQHFVWHVSATGGFLIVIDCDSQPLISHLLFGASGIGATTIGFLKTGGVGLGSTFGVGVGLGVKSTFGVGLGVTFGFGVVVVGITLGWVMGGSSFVM